MAVSGPVDGIAAVGMMQAGKSMPGATKRTASLSRRGCSAPAIRVGELGE